MNTAVFRLENRHRRSLAWALAAGALLASAQAGALAATAALAAQGKVLYAENYATCHSLSLRGSAHGNTLRGAGFLDKW